MPTTQPAHPIAEAPPTVVTYVCGIVCKGQQGLTMHQRSCAVLRSLHDQHTTADRPTGAEVDVNEYPDLHLAAADCTISPQQIGKNESDTELMSTLSAVKLPKCKQRWEEANLYFRLYLDMSVSISDINAYAVHLQTLIYDYFESNYGTVDGNQKADQFEKKYAHSSIKILKRQLAVLKSDGSNVPEIIYLSKLIRRRVKPVSDSISVQSMNSQLQKSFWKACKQLFNQSVRIIPSFSLEGCFDFFKTMLSQPKK